MNGLLWSTLTCDKREIDPLNEVSRIEAIFLIRKSNLFMRRLYIYEHAQHILVLVEFDKQPSCQ